jgi:hypothetical protein
VVAYHARSKPFLEDYPILGIVICITATSRARNPSATLCLGLDLDLRLAPLYEKAAARCASLERENQPLHRMQIVMTDPKQILDNRDQSAVKTPRTDSTLRANLGRRCEVEILSHLVVECSPRTAGVASGIECNETDCLLSLVLDPLQTAKTGQEAVLEMLNGVLSAGLSMPAGPNAPFSAILPGSGEADSTGPISRQWRHSLRNLIDERLERSVHEGELPEDAALEVLSCLCTSFASGLVVSLQDGISAASLAKSICLFVESLGFHRVRRPKRSSVTSPSVMRQGITLVKR